MDLYQQRQKDAHIMGPNYKTSIRDSAARRLYNRLITDSMGLVLALALEWTGILKIYSVNMSVVPLGSREKEMIHEKRSSR
jgi:hypothetical protein